MSLAAAGCRVTLIAPVKEKNACNAVAIHPFPVFHRAFVRILIAPWLMLWHALHTPAAIYHFHDPELIPTGLLLRLLTRKPVVYDIHEDVAASIMVREYIPDFLRRALSRGYRLLERFACRFFTVVLAEKYYQDFQPRGVCILNYPVLDQQARESVQGHLPRAATGQIPLPASGTAGTTTRVESDAALTSPPAHNLFYSGSVTRQRGALQHARLAAALAARHVGVYSAGRVFPDELVGEMQAAADAGALIIEGGRESVARQRLDELGTRYDWVAGLALFPYSEHYARKELTKFFEYMLAGIPILCSDFPAWKEFVEEQGIGLTANPEDTTEQVEKVQWLIDHPAERQAMGERGRKLVLELFNWDQEARKLVDIYRALAGTPPATVPATVCHLVLSLAPGGLENGLVNLANRLDTRAVASRILCIRRRGSMAGRVQAEVPVDCLGYESGFHLRGTWQIARYLRHHAVHILHTRNQTALIWGGLARLLCPRVLHIHSEHGTPINPRPIARWLARRADVLMAVAPNLAAEMRTFYRLPPTREIRVVPNGVDTECFAPLTEGTTPSAPSERPVTDQQDTACDLRSILGLSPHAFLFGCVGRMDTNKNQQLAVTAFARLLNLLTPENTPEDVPTPTCPEVALVLIGDGPERVALEKFANDLGLPVPPGKTGIDSQSTAPRNGSVLFLGFRADVPVLLPQLNVLLLPSKREGMSNVILEANACGVPVLASDIAANHSVVQESQNGQLLPLEAPEKWAESMRLLVLDRENARQLARNARQTAVAEYSLQKMVERYTELYLTVRSQRAP